MILTILSVVLTPLALLLAAACAGIGLAYWYTFYKVFIDPSLTLPDPNRAYKAAIDSMERGEPLWLTNAYWDEVMYSPLDDLVELLVLSVLFSAAAYLIVSLWWNLVSGSLIFW